MNGRRYRLVSGAEGTHEASMPTSCSRAAMKSASGSCGSARRAAERCRRRAFSSGRNAQTEPSACRYAFSPSKISWA